MWQYRFTWRNSITSEEQAHDAKEADLRIGDHAIAGGLSQRLSFVPSDVLSATLPVNILSDMCGGCLQSRKVVQVQQYRGQSAL